MDCKYRHIDAVNRGKCSIIYLWCQRRNAKQYSSMESYISKHSVCDMAYYKIVTKSTSLSRLRKMKLKIQCISFTVSTKTAAHRFSPPRCPDGIETIFSTKTNTFQDCRREVIL